MRKGTLRAGTYGLACALLVIFAPGRLKAQIGIYPSGTALASNYSTGSSITFSSLTVPSSGLPNGDTYFIVGVSCFGSGACGTSFTWTGTVTGSWTQLGSSINDNFRTAEIWYVKGPSGSSKNLTVTITASKMVAGVLFVAGVNTSTPFGTTASANNGGGTGTVPNPITLAVTGTQGLVSGDLVVAVGTFHQSACGGSSAGNVTGCNSSAASPATETTQWEVLEGTSSAVVGLGGTALATSTSQTMGWTTAAAGNAWSIIAAPVHSQGAPKRKGQTIVGELGPIRGTIPEATGN